MVSGRTSKTRRRLLTGALSVAGHAFVVAALFLWHPRPPVEVDAPPMMVVLYQPPPVIKPPERPTDEKAPAPKSEAPPVPDKPPPPDDVPGGFAHASLDS